jgi:hypothetical protein
VLYTVPKERSTRPERRSARPPLDVARAPFDGLPEVTRISRIACGIAAGAILLTAAIASAEAPADLKLEADLDGAPLTGCTATAIPTTPDRTPLSAEAPGTLSLPAGTYELRLVCPRGQERFAQSEALTVRAGQQITKRFSMKSTRLRVVAKRDGALVPATVLVLPVDAKIDAPPLTSFPSNQKFTLAAGQYDVVVRLETKNEADRAEAKLSKVKVQGEAVREVTADLSDGSFVVTVSENGRPAEGSVRAFRPGAKLHSGNASAGATLALRPGPYVIETTLGTAADFPSHRTPIWIEAGKTSRMSERFETGQLTVGVYRERKPVEATVRLSLPGAEDFFNYFASPGTVSLTPGLYDVIVAPAIELPVTKLRRPRVSVSKGKENKIAFDLSPARLSVRVRRSGKAVELAEVQVVAAGGGREAAKPESDGSYLLWPGRYEIVARLPDGDETTDGPFEVGFGESLSRTIEFSRGVLTVHVTRGSAVADDAEIFVYRKGAQKPLSQGRPRSLLELPPGSYDIKIVAGAETLWREDVRVKEGKTVRVDVKLSGTDGGSLPEGDLAPIGDDLPEGEAP